MKFYFKWLKECVLPYLTAIGIVVSLFVLSVYFLTKDMPLIATCVLMITIVFSGTLPFYYGWLFDKKELGKKK
jgi:hypothetical protein